jgi:hypothetical protein
MELAIVMPLLVLLVLGIAEFGMGWRDRITVQNAVRSAARTASALGDDPTADYQLLQNLRAGLDTQTLANVKVIVVYNSKFKDGKIPTACRNSSQTGLCNRYTAADLAAPLSSFGCDVGDLDFGWCPTSRNVSGTDPDYVGIYIEVEHDFMTALFNGSGLTIVDRAVTRLEPA